jgi:hypothetical protein
MQLWGINFYFPLPEIFTLTFTAGKRTLLSDKTPVYLFSDAHGIIGLLET